MRTQAFNDVASPEGRVSGGGPEVTVQGQGSSGGKQISGVQQMDGAANLGAAVQTKRAGEPASVGRSKPTSLAVESFDDASV